MIFPAIAQAASSEIIAPVTAQTASEEKISPVFAQTALGSMISKYGIFIIFPADISRKTMSVLYFDLPVMNGKL